MRTACTLFLLAAVTFRMGAEEKFVFENTPGKLPKALVPRHYLIHLEPDLEGMRTEGSKR
jgi:aminopeptidase N